MRDQEKRDKNAEEIAKKMSRSEKKKKKRKKKSKSEDSEPEIESASVSDSESERKSKKKRGPVEVYKDNMKEMEKLRKEESSERRSQKKQAKADAAAAVASSSSRPSKLGDAKNLDDSEEEIDLEDDSNSGSDGFLDYQIKIVESPAMRHREESKVQGWRGLPDLMREAKETRDIDLEKEDKQGANLMKFYEEVKSAQQVWQSWSDMCIKALPIINVMISSLPASIEEQVKKRKEEEDGKKKESHDEDLKFLQQILDTFKVPSQ